jgi:GNAT superfamily N-acetyltransferase
MRLTDAPTVALLSAQLGYEATTAEITRRFAKLNGDPDSGLFVAARGGAVVGWLHVCGVRLLETDGYAEVGGLVVDAAQRRRGIGRALIRRAERWAVANGFTELRLRSGVHRSEAHRFYARIGYDLAKTSHMFRKDLS